MKFRYVLVLVVLVVGFFALRASLTPIGGGWSIGRPTFGSSQSLVRVRDHGILRRTTVSKGVTEYRFFEPDCVIYTATSSFDGDVYLAACGDRTPITVETTKYSITPIGLQYLLRHDTFDEVEKTTERHIPLGRILNRARMARPYSSSSVPRSGNWKGIEVTYAHYPVAYVEWNQAGHTALHDAVSNGCTALLSSMLEQGVWPDLPDNKGVTPLMLTVIMQADNALAFDYANMLLSAGANVNAQANNGMTPLMYAKRAGAMATYSMMIESGADTTLTNAGGQTASQMQTVAGYDPLSRSDTSTADRCPP